MNEMIISLDGIKGKALDEMRKRGWQIATTPMEFKQQINGSVITVDAMWKAGFRKLGKPATKEEWNAELLEVWNELNAPSL